MLQHKGNKKGFLPRNAGLHKGAAISMYKRFFKRTADIIISLLGLVVLSPVFLIIAAAIKADSKGPVIFKQKRIGFKGKVFNVYKFQLYVY